MAVDPSKYQIYAEKDLNRAQIDWGTVGKTLSDGLISIAKEREARKQQIADDTVDAMNKLSEVPDVNNQTLSALIINGSEQSKQELQSRMDLVRRGIIKPKDYKLFMNAQQNGYKSLSTAVQNYDKYYVETMKAIESGETSGLNEYVAETIEQFGNLKNKVLWTNPSNGQLQLVTMQPDADGNFSVMPDPNKNPELFQNPNNINTIMRFNEKRKVLQDEAKKVTDTIASYIRSSVANGVVTKKEDFRDQTIGGKTYDEWMESQVNNLTATDNDVAQILSNQGYRFAASEAEYEEKYGKDADKSLFIQVDNSSGKPVLTLSEEQEETARQLAREAIDSQIDSIITKTPGFDPNRESVARRRDEDIDDAGYIRELNTIMTGNKTDAEAALKRRIDTKNASVQYEDDKIVSFDITDDQIILRRKKGDPFIIDRKQDTGVADDPTTPEDESINVLSTLDDIVSINDVLAPKPLSKGKIQDLIQRENITLGQRREGDISSRTPKSEIEVFSPTTLNPTSQTSLFDDVKDVLGDTTRGQRNPTIKNMISNNLTKHMPPELQNEIQNNPSLYGPTTVVKGEGNVMIVTIAGETTEISTEGGRTSQQVADDIASAINKAREKVNKNRTNPNAAGSQKLSFSEWRKENPGGLYSDWKKTQ